MNNGHSYTGLDNAYEIVSSLGNAIRRYEPLFCHRSSLQVVIYLDSGREGYLDFASVADVCVVGPCPTRLEAPLMPSKQTYTLIRSQPRTWISC